MKKQPNLTEALRELAEALETANQNIRDHVRTYLSDPEGVVEEQYNEEQILKETYQLDEEDAP